MSTELVKIDGRDVAVSVAGHLSGQVAVGAIVPLLTATVRTLAGAATQVRRILIEAVREHQVEIALMDQRARILRRDVVPIMALAGAHQLARNVLDRSGFDADIHADAAQDLEAVRQLRRRRMFEQWQA